MDVQNNSLNNNPINSHEFNLNSLNKEKEEQNKMSSYDKKKKLMFIVGIFSLVLIGLGVYAYFSTEYSLFKSPIGTESPESIDELSVVSPLTGVKYSEEDSADWISTRPLGVMVNNHPDARPQSGLIYADFVYEIVAEGGITRYLAFFNSTIPEKIGPVRSVREYYLVLVKELGDAMLMHIGWSPQALTAIESWPVRSLGRGGGDFWRDNPRNVATEHTAYVNGKDLLEVGMNLGWEGTSEFTLWEFKEDGLMEGETSTAANKITIDFWESGDFSPTWVYNNANNTYLRSLGYDDAGVPIPDLDQETKDQIEVKNVVVQFATESGIVGDDKSRLEYELVGSGEGMVFIDGVVHNVTWTKTDRDSRTMYFDENGESFKFNRGKFWVAIVPDRNTDQVVFE